MKKNFPVVLTWVILLAFPDVNRGQTPFLGTAADFVLFTNSGAIVNTQRSQLTGNVGTNSGSNSGFGNVNGVMHTADAATIQAAIDVADVYSDLNTRTPSAPHGPSLGNGETLGSGVYDITGATTLNGSLTLNGGGRANALFIFKINSTFTATDFSQILLTNGTLACNIFWKVEGVVSLLSGSTIKGTFVNQAAINMSPGVNLEGRVLSMNGPVNVVQVTAYTPIGCGSPVLTGPPAPDLRTTANFGLFSGTGEVANNGVTYIRGDVGTNSSIPTGFDALHVSGMIHPGPDNATREAANDLLLVYDYLNGLTPDIELLFPADFGHDLVLTPHTYHMSSAPALTGTVFLNAQDNPDAVFVIQINGALSTSANAKIILTNGAQAKNVFWKVDGAVSIGNNSEFAGTIVVNNAAIDLTSGVQLAGRALTTVGAINTAGVTTTMNADGTLPVTWLSFAGRPVGKHVLLEWSTVDELNNGFFTIQKSRDGRNFQTLATVNAHGEIKNSQYHYSFMDKLPYNYAYYSISQTDKDGQKSYYKTIGVKMNMNESFKGLHYVRQNYIYVSASGAAPGNGLLKLYSLTGKLMSSKTILLTKDISTYRIDTPLPAGLYLLQLESKGMKLYSKKVIVY